MRIWWERFWPKVEIGDCWTWQGAKNSRGYGQFWNGEKVQYGQARTTERIGDVAMKRDT